MNSMTIMKNNKPKKEPKARITISIDPNVFKKINEIIKPFGGKISTLIETLLKRYSEVASLEKRSLLEAVNELKQDTKLIESKINEELKMKVGIERARKEGKFKGRKKGTI